MNAIYTQLFIALLMAAYSFTALGQGVSINENNSPPNPSAMLDVQSTDKGFLPPRMTSSERNNIVSPAKGLIVFDMDSNNLQIFDGSQWQVLYTLDDNPWQPNQSDIYFTSGNVGIGTTAPENRLHVAGSILSTTSNWGIRGIKTGSGTFPGVWGETESGSSNATGVRGFVLSTTPGSGSSGVHGRNFGTGNQGYGVHGSHDGGGVGVYGRSESGHGVYGQVTANSGTTFGVRGQVSSSEGYSGYFTGGSFYVNGNVGLGTLTPEYRLHAQGSIFASSGSWAIRGVKTGTGSFPGVWGETESTSNNASGVRGFVTSTNPGSGSAGVHGRNFGTGINGIGVRGTHDAGGYGVMGESVSGRGVFGYATGAAGLNYAVFGFTESASGYSAYFAGATGSKNYFQRNVGIGASNPTSLLHVLGTSSSSSPLIRAESAVGVSYDGTAVFGKAASVTNAGTGGFFQGGRTGVYGYVVGSGTTNMMYGLRSEIVGGNQGGIRYGGFFRITESFATNYAVYAETSGILSTHYAGYFNGNVTVTGNFSNPSDLSLKQNIQDIDNSLDKIIQLNGKVYEHKLEAFPFINLPGGAQFGFIAQELEQIFPELVNENIHPGADPYYDTDKEHRNPIEYKGINYIGLIPVMTEAIKEQQQIINNQQEMINELMARISKLEQQSQR